MKSNCFKSLLIVMTALIAVSCEFDNFEAPKSQLSGRIVYNGEALGLRSTGVQVELWQHGYDLFQKIPVHVDQDGGFSATVFDGDYKMTLIRGNGPWMDQTDSIDVQVRGSQMVDVEVAPYYMISNSSVVRNGSNLDVTFTLTGVNTDRELEFAAIYFGRTIITDEVRNEGRHLIPAESVTLGTPITVQIPIPPSLATRSDVFVRIGAKTLGVPELIYTQSKAY